MTVLGALLGCAIAMVPACSSPPSPEDAALAAWTRGLDLPTPRLEPGVTALGQRLVVLGGFDQSAQQGLRITTDVVALDPAAGAWVTLPPAPVAWTHANLAASGATLYLLGGAEGTQFEARGDTYALDTLVPDTTWRRVTSMPAGAERSAAAIVIAPPRIYLLGGASTTTALSTCLAYNFASDTWETLPDLPAPRSHPAAMRRSDGTLIVAGGLSSLASTSPTTEVWELPPGAASWVAKAPMLAARGGCAYGTISGHLVCAGGEAGAAALIRVESYDPIVDVWTAEADMPEARAGTQGAVVGGRLYVPGGAASLHFEPTSTVYAFSPLAP